MKIKRLEISGFKSFADKIVIDFQQPVTGVVGPNGCGKSNIVDAIRWCMGEQSAKHLRGKAMEDVIFAGSETRKPLGMAEVSLTFSTEDGRAPTKYLDYAEIQLTRRLYRDGESDYLINKIPCRLLDITELFMDTGVGTRAYSIIEQGKIGQILHSRPEERRFLIEEAAGVTKFKSRKLVALKKIDSTRQNLTRLADVLGEIKRQLSSLQRQAKKAEKFREYRDEAREIDLLFAAREYRKMQEQSRLVQVELAGVDAELQRLGVAAVAASADGESARLSLIEKEKHLNISQETIYRLKSEFATTENSQEFHHKELAALESRLEKLAQETHELEIRLQEYAAKQDLLELRKNTSTNDTSTLASDLIRLETVLAEQQERENQLNRTLEEERKNLFTRLSETAQHKTRHDNGRKRHSQLLERLQRNRQEALQLGERLDGAKKRCASCIETIRLTEEQQSASKTKLAILREEESTIAGTLPELEKLWQSRHDELNRTSSRLHSLKELEAQFAGFGQGARNLMKTPDYRARFTGILADGIRAPQELEAAVEASLAERLQALICSDSENALQALEHLRATKGGRVSLAIPVEATIPECHIKNATMLLDQLQLQGELAPLLRLLLSSVLLVHSLHDAIPLAAQYPDKTFVTRQGDLITDGGIISGGSPEQLQSGVIHKKREIRELESRVAELEHEVSSLAAERERLRNHSRDVANSLKNLHATIHQIELKLAGLLKDRQQGEEEIARIIERQTVQSMETGTLSEEEAQLEKELTVMAATIAETETASHQMEETIARFKEELDSHRQLLAATREAVTTTRVQVATVREQHEAHLRELSELQQQREDTTRRFGAVQQELQNGNVKKVELNESLATGKIALEELLTRQSAAESQLKSARDDFEKAGEFLSSSESAHKKLRDEIDTIRSRQSELTVRHSTLTMQTEHGEQGMLEKSRISMGEALARLETTDFDENSRGVRRQELQRLLDEMGEVNLMAIDEYAAMEERFTFLSTQKDDLEESLKGLQQAIQRINRTTRQRFQETYELVNAKFKEVFPRLFCGGGAELRLTNEEDLLETGIDIIVQPPGKKLQNVTLLSGGEKALTAVALIFSIFLIKPTPFCLLDEVDAPLDDANIGRFNDMVREMSGVSQFIIITHNKATMQVADTLYGITMEEPGASKVVSVRLH